MNKSIITLSSEIATLERKKRRIVRKQENLINEMKRLLSQGESKGQTDDNSVVVLLNGKKLRMDLNNHKDSELAFFNPKNGEHYFTQENALKAAKKVGKRLPTNDEHKAICDCENWWDDTKKGRWFSLPTPEGDYVDVFYPASGLRYSASGAFAYTGTLGFCWCSAVTGTNGYVMNFYSTDVNPSTNGYRALGFGVRLIQDY